MAFVRRSARAIRRRTHGSCLNICFTLPVLVGNRDRHQCARTVPKPTLVEQHRRVTMHGERSGLVGGFRSHETARFVEERQGLARRHIQPAFESMATSTTRRNDELPLTAVRAHRNTGGPCRSRRRCKMVFRSKACSASGVPGNPRYTSCICRIAGCHSLVPPSSGRTPTPNVPPMLMRDNPP